MKTRGTQPYLLCNCSYIQQLREGVHNFFVTFIEVLRDRPPGHDWELEPGVTCGDYLFGMLHVQHFIFIYWMQREDGAACWGGTRGVETDGLV